MRVSIARALVTEPTLLLMDEPFAALDEITRFKLNDDLLALWRALGKTVVFVTHSVFESVYLSSRIVVMTPRPGRVVHRARDRCAVSARRALPHLGGICRLLPAGLRGAGAAPWRRGAACMSEPPTRSTHGQRGASAAARAAAGSPCWRSACWSGTWWCGSTTFRPTCCPGPAWCSRTLVADWAILSVVARGHAGRRRSKASLLAVVGGVGLAVLFNQSRLVEYSLYPYAVILQVTPVVAIAPLLLIYLPQQAAVLACAWIVAFFPVLANTTLGLNSVDHNLVDLFRLYGASRWQVLWYLKLPAALPYMLGGLEASPAGCR